jgi:hypothetical protein
MKISHHKITFIFCLHAHIILDCPKITSKVQKTGRPDPAHDDLFLLVHNGGEDKDSSEF